MKIFLVSNQPERTTRLQLFRKTLLDLGHDVVVPSFSSRNWITVALESKAQIKQTKPDIVHIFNVPDIIYRNIPKLKGKYYDKLIYDYRSLWGIELGEYIGGMGRVVGEYYERRLTRAADIITAVNIPLGIKIGTLIVIPNYPEKRTYASSPIRSAILFVGRMSRLEGARNLEHLVTEMDDEIFWVVGDGPYKLKQANNLTQFGWKSHEETLQIISRARVCIVPRDETKLTPYATDKSIWKVNEYLNAGKIVVASGITKEGDRKNLHITPLDLLVDEIRRRFGEEPEKLEPCDYRFWEDNKEMIREVYEL